MNKKTTTWIIVIVILIIIAVCGYYFSKSNSTKSATDGSMAGEMQDGDSMDMMASQTPSPTTAEQAGQLEVGASVHTPTTVTFNVSGNNFSYTPNSIKVKKGDTVKIVFSNAGGMHNWVIDEFSAKTNIIKTGESETIQFVADKTGSFEYYCSVGTHRQMGMKGTLIVE